MTTLFTDNFTRANGTLLGNWTTVPGTTSWAISSDVAEGNVQASDADAYVNSVSWPNDQWAQVTVGAIGNVDQAGVGPVVRSSTTGLTGYIAIANGSGHLYLSKAVLGTFTSLGSSPYSASVTTGDVLYMSVVGTTIIVQKNGTTVATVTDSSIASGSAGMYYSSQDSVVDTVTAYSAGNFITNSCPIAWIG